MLPNADTVFELWQRALNKVLQDQLKLSDGFISGMDDPGDLLSHLDIIIDVLWHYNLVLPQQLGDVSGQVGAMLEGLHWLKSLLHITDDKLTYVVINVLKLAASFDHSVTLMAEKVSYIPYIIWEVWN